MRYIITEDMLEDNSLGWTPDQLAEALRHPLEAIGVEVVRQRDEDAGSGRGGCHGGELLDESAYKAKFDEVSQVVRRVVRAGPRDR
jgi:hypothetical protein